MGSPAVIDLDALLAPVIGDLPVGHDIRADSSPTSLYYRIKDARMAARAAERADVDEEGGRPEQWQEVLDTATAILGDHAKDLEVAAWMTEALVRLHGFAGLRDGLRLITGLAENFWDGLYPLPDEDGMETRVAPVTGLNGEGAEGTLILPIRKLALTQGGETDYALWQFEQASELSRMADGERKTARVNAGALTMDKFTAAVNATDDAFLRRLVAEVDESQQALAALAEMFRSKAGAADAPPTGKIRDTLEAVRDAVRFFAAGRLEDRNAVAAAEEPEIADTIAAPAPAAAPAIVKRRDGYADREEAMADLLRVAAWFRQHEPHSPLSYTLEEAVRRGRLSLPELLAELLSDEAARRMFLTASGIRPNEGNP